MLDPDRQPESDDPRPWERPGAVRRDCEPHRGALLARLGLASGCLGFASVFVVPLALLALPLALVVWRRAGADLGKIRAGLMDPEGAGPTEEAWWNSVFGAAASAAALLLWAFVLLAGLLGGHG
jgi:hypothetical protein